MDYEKEYAEKAKDWDRYSQIRLLVNQYFELQEGKKYEDFIRKLVMILEV